MTLRKDPYVTLHWSLIIYYSQLDRVAVQFFAITIRLYQQWFSYFLRKIRRSRFKLSHLYKFSLSLSCIFLRKTDPTIASQLFPGTGSRRSIKNVVTKYEKIKYCLNWRDRDPIRYNYEGSTDLILYPDNTIYELI